MNIYLFCPLRHIALVLAFHKSHKPHSLQMRVAKLILYLEEQKVVGRLGRDPFALFAAISYYVSICVCAAVIRQVLALFGNTMQAMGEGKMG